MVSGSKHDLLSMFGSNHNDRTTAKGPPMRTCSGTLKNLQARPPPLMSVPTAVEYALPIIWGVGGGGDRVPLRGCYSEVPVISICMAGWLLNIEIVPSCNGIGQASCSTVQSLLKIGVTGLR